MTGARLVVKNYIPFMTKILQNTLSLLSSEPYSLTFKHLGSLLIHHFKKFHIMLFVKDAVQAQLALHRHLTHSGFLPAFDYQ